MLIRNLPTGIYLIKRTNQKLGIIDHYGVLGIGYIKGSPFNNNEDPMILHLIYPRVKLEYFKNTDGSWELISKVSKKHQKSAIKRINFALQNPFYNLITNNCEQFARYITQGSKYSKQIQQLVLLVALGFLFKSIYNYKKLY